MDEVLKSNKVIGHISVDPDLEKGRENARELGCILHQSYHRCGLISSI